MSDIAIRAEGVGKRYQIGAQQASYKTIRETLTELAKAPLRLFNQQTNSNHEKNIFWALKDISFEIEDGEAVGVIGRNGAGKSTLLKLLSRITAPSTGYIDLYGRVASLLEVGTGFHHELTGRENIYLNGAILGMRRQEIERKFDEIVDFAEIEKFIDTPVKHYSSGMYMRLAFAVAAHLEPEILLVDEVLAVGDAAFQQKCLGKMSDVAKGGRTILFVSHNMVAISQLCTKCIWLDHGQVKSIGLPRDVIDQYSSTVKGITEGQFSGNNIKGDGRVELISYQVTNQHGESFPLPVTNEDVLIHIKLKALEAINHPACGINIWNARGVLMTSINTVEQGVILPSLPAGEVSLTIRIDKIVYLPGLFIADFWVMNPQNHIYAMAEQAITFELGQTPLYGTNQVDHRWGSVYSKVSFELAF